MLSTVLLAAALSIPTTLPARWAHVKIAWVSASVAFSEDGELRGEYFESYQRTVFDRNRQSNSSGKCEIFMGAPIMEIFKPMSTLEDLARESESIVAGEIAGSDTGFFAGMAGTLYAIRVSDWLKTLGHTVEGDVIYMFYPEATIPTKQGTLCAKTFSGLPPPQAGDRVLVFDYLQAFDRERRILHPEADHMLILERDGKLYVPRALQKSIDGAQLDDLIARVR